MGDENFIINVYKMNIFMFENVDQVHGHFLQYAFFLGYSRYSHPSRKPWSQFEPYFDS